MRAIGSVAAIAAALLAAIIAAPTAAQSQALRPIHMPIIPIAR